MTEHPGLGLTDVYAAVIPNLPFNAGLHVHYSDTVLHVRDGLPKFKDLPKEFGALVSSCRSSGVRTQALPAEAHAVLSGHALPYQRFACSLTTARASLGVGVARCGFTVTDLHRLPSAGLPAHPSTASTAELEVVDPTVLIPGILSKIRPSQLS